MFGRDDEDRIFQQQKQKNSLIPNITGLVDGSVENQIAEYNTNF